MPSKKSEASKQMTTGFPTDLPAGSGEHEARFFIDPRVRNSDGEMTPKSVAFVENVQPDGSVERVRLLSYSMLVDYQGSTHCCYVEVRKHLDFIVAPGDDSMEQELDRDLAKAMRGEFVDTITILAKADYTDRNNKLVIAKNGRANLA
jgi:hypothetical protein